MLRMVKIVHELIQGRFHVGGKGQLHLEQWAAQMALLCHGFWIKKTETRGVNWKVLLQELKPLRHQTPVFSIHLTRQVVTFLSAMLSPKELLIPHHIFPPLFPRLSLHIWEWQIPMLYHPLSLQTPLLTCGVCREQWGFHWQGASWGWHNALEIFTTPSFCAGTLTHQ